MNEETNAKNHTPLYREVEIPKVFKTFISEEYFKNCIVCSCNLLDGENDYYIEKSIKKGYVEFEYAICIKCAENMKNRFSKKSIAAITDYFDKKQSVIINNRLSLSTNYSAKVDDYIQICIFNGKSKDTLEEYQIIAHCRGAKLLLSIFPYMVSFDIIEDIQELLSAETKEEMDRFTKEHFGLPPELLELVSSKKVFLL